MVQGIDLSNSCCQKSINTLKNIIFFDVRKKKLGAEGTHPDPVSLIPPVSPPCYIVYFSTLVANSANVATCHAHGLVATIGRGIVHLQFDAFSRNHGTIWMLICKFFTLRICWSILTYDEYSKGLDAQQTAFTVKKYKSHCCVGLPAEIITPMWA